MSALSKCHKNSNLPNEMSRCNLFLTVHKSGQKASETKQKEIQITFFFNIVAPRTKIGQQ